MPVIPATRRDFLRNFAVAGIGAALAWRLTGSASTKAAAAFEVTKTEAEWKALLTPEQFAVLRRHGTERPRSSPLEAEKRKGVFACAACGLALFDSAAKFESGTGWPSFSGHLPDAVRTATDYVLVLPRTEVHCRRCGGHLGHVFDDGRQPTGKRFCMNGAAMTFRPA
jgi:peptide-methionine (R)-S-oxide reductase